MSENKWGTGLTVSAVLVVVLLFVGLLVGKSTTADTAPTTTTVPSGTCSQADSVSAVLVAAGFTPDQFTIGEGHFDLSLPAALQAGNGKFADTPPTTRQAYTAFLSSGTPAAEALIQALMVQAGGTREQVLNPSNWEGFQLLVPSEWSGNTLFIGGEVRSAGTRNSTVGDIGWVFINPDDCNGSVNVVRIAVVRMGCGNPQLVPPNPVGKPVPPAQPLLPLKPPISWECQQNGGPGCPPTVPPQAVQNNPCCNVGPTPGAPPNPYTPPPGPTPQPGTPAPPPNQGGYDSGSSNGSGTPGGSMTNPDGSTSGGGATPPSSPPVTVDTGTHTGDSGGF